MTTRDPATNPAAFLGAELRRARTAAGFSSQESLAAKLGFDRTVVAKAETGERPPTPDVLTAWCAARRIPGPHLGGCRTVEGMTKPIWRKSSYSGNGGGDCIEVATSRPGKVAVRDSKDPSGPQLTVPDRAWSRFIQAIKHGALDL